MRFGVSERGSVAHESAVPHAAQYNNALPVYTQLPSCAQLGFGHVDRRPRLQRMLNLSSISALVIRRKELPFHLSSEKYNATHHFSSAHAFFHPNWIHIDNILEYKMVSIYVIGQEKMKR